MEKSINVIITGIRTCHPLRLSRIVGRL